MFDPPAPPPLADVRQYANKLVGAAALEVALRDPWIEAQLQRDISIYETNYIRGFGNMPQLIIGTNLVFSTFDRVDDLYRLLSDNLGLRPNRP